MYTELAERLEREEGRETHLYKDTKGLWTIGIGYHIEEKGLPDDIIDELFRRTLREAALEAPKVVDNYHTLSEPRQSVLVAMVFQMGLPRVLGFKKMRDAIERGNFELAGAEMLDSKWARSDSPARALREANIMRLGRYPAARV